VSKTFKKGTINGVTVRELKRFLDHRGWLCELFREDELSEEVMPVMSYCSLTYPGIARGPHAHKHQTDIFCFVGPGNFEVRLWDNRPESPTYGIMQKIFAGADRPMSIIVPPGVVHGYKVVGPEPGLVFNCPNRLYAGRGRMDEVDEIRYEDHKESPFKL